MLTTNNDAILVNYGTFVVCLEKSLKYFDQSPFGVDTRWFIDPTRAESGHFLDLLQKLDALTFGPEGMPMDKWVFYDCAELPGFIYGFAMPAEEMTEREIELFGTPPGYDGPVPISMYIAIPMHEPGCWFGHNLASLNPTLPDRKLGFLATLTKAMGIKAYQMTECFGATQWQSRALNVHTRFGPLDLLTAYTAAHSFAETLTYSFPVDDNCIKAAMGDIEAESKIVRPQPEIYLAADNVRGMVEIQKQIEAGERYQIVSKASWIGDQGVYPIAHLKGA